MNNRSYNDTWGASHGHRNGWLEDASRHNPSMNRGLSSWGQSRINRSINNGNRHSHSAYEREDMSSYRRRGTPVPSNTRSGSSCPLCSRSAVREENSPCGCGCRQSNQGNGDCQKLMEQIQAVDFALCEVILYLDAYPDSCEALDTYHKLLCRRRTLQEQYEEACGPITATGNRSTTRWDWVSKPNPWEYTAN